MVFSHVGTGHQDDGLADEAELADTAGAGTADDQVGSTIGGAHIADEVGHLQVGQLLVLQALLDVGKIEFSRLPEQLHIGLFHQVQMLQDALIDGACAKRATNKQDGLLRRVETEAANGILTRHLRLKQGLAYGIARQHDLLLREEALHTLVGHTDLPGL